MCPCDSSAHTLCGYHRRQILADIQRLRAADAAGHGYDDDIRALRGRLAQLGWKRELVEQELDAADPQPAEVGAA